MRDLASAALQATRGYIHWSYANIGVQRDPDPLSQVDACIEKVLAANPASARGFFLKGLRAVKSGDMPTAVRYLRRSADIEPSFDTFAWLSMILAEAGQTDEAERLGSRARELDPLTPATTASLGFIYLYSGKADTALVWGRKAVELDPTDVIALLCCASILAQTGRSEQALVLFDRLAALKGGVWTSLGIVLAHALRHDRERVLEAALDVVDAAKTDHYYSLVLAEAHALVGARDEALAWLENAVQLGFINHPFLARWDTLLDNVRFADRFAALIARVEERWGSFEGSQALTPRR